MRCPNCNSMAWKNGFNEREQQLYKCKSCYRQFTFRSKSAFTRARYPKRDIIYALKLRKENGLSTYAIAKLLNSRGVSVSHVSVFKWIKKYSQLYDQNELTRQVREIRENMMENAAE